MMQSPCSLPRRCDGCTLEQKGLPQLTACVGKQGAVMASAKPVAEAFNAFGQRQVEELQAQRRAEDEAHVCLPVLLYFVKPPERHVAIILAQQKTRSHIAPVLAVRDLA